MIHIMGLFSTKIYLPVPSRKVRERKVVEEPQGSERGRRHDLQIFGVASNKEQHARPDVRRVPPGHWHVLQCREIFVLSIKHIWSQRWKVYSLRSAPRRHGRQDSHTVNNHGMPFSPVLQERWKNYNKLREQGVAIQTRIPLADGEETEKEGHSEKGVG